MRILKNIFWNLLALFFGVVFILPAIFIQLITLGEFHATEMWSNMINEILSNKKY